MRGMVVLIAVLAIGCGSKKKSRIEATSEDASKAAICADLVEQQRRVARILAGEEAARLEAELAPRLADFEKGCLAWSDEVFDCIRRRDEGPVCERALREATAEAMGEAREVDMAAGPAPAWTFALAKPPQPAHAVALGEGGVVFAAAEATIWAIKDGALLWERTLEENVRDLRVDAGGALWVLWRSNRLLRLDPATGQDQGGAEVPLRGEYPPNGRLVGWAEAPGGGQGAGSEGTWVVMADDGRFFELDPRKRKLAPAGALVDEELDADAQLVIGADGTRFLVEYGTLRAFTPALEPLFSIKGYDYWGGVVPAPGRLVVATIDDEVLTLAIDACRSAAPLRLRRASGERGPDDGEACEDCVDAPTGCVGARGKKRDADHVAPALAGDHVLMVAEGEVRTLGLLDLAPSSAVQARASGRVLVGPDGRRHVICAVPDAAAEEGLGDWPVAVCELGDAAGAGRAAWRAPLGFTAKGIFSLDDLHLERRGRWLLAGYERHLALIALP